MDAQISHPMTTGAFASSPPRIAARQANAWFAENGYTDDVDANICVHAALTSVLCDAPMFGLRLGLQGGRRDSAVDVYVFQMSKVMKSSVFGLVIDHALKLAAPHPSADDSEEVRIALQKRSSAFEDFAKSRQARQNTFFYGFVTYEEAAPSLIIGAGPKVATTIEVVVGAFAFKQPKERLTAAEVDELGVLDAASEMRRRGGRLFRFPPPAAAVSALAEYVLRAQVDSEKQQEDEEARAHSGLVLPAGSPLVR